MRVYDNDANLYLLVDIDDFLVYSSDKLQSIVNEKTNFKTDVLRMLEQLNRNCNYLVDEVTKECRIAKETNRIPDLKRFLVFNNFACDDKELYTKPIDFAKYYSVIANSLLNQFLEERDTFLEIDNMSKGSIKEFDYKKEMENIVKYCEIIANNKDAIHKINQFCLKRLNKLIEEAQWYNKDGELTIPRYGALVSMDTNDIIKKNSLLANNSFKYRQYILYKKPYEDLKRCIELEEHLYDIVTNAKILYTPSDEIVDYNEIHSLANVNWDAVTLVEGLIHSGLFKGVYFSTHHNGTREEEAKIRLMRKILPEANGFIGQRFHDTEHNVIRRSRSSKIDRAVLYLGIMPSQIVLLDDSKANCYDCNMKGGTAILYKPETDSEKMNGRIEETGFNRILDLKNNDVNSFIDEAYKKQKRMVKEKK